MSSAQVAESVILDRPLLPPYFNGQDVGHSGRWKLADILTLFYSNVKHLLYCFLVVLLIVVAYRWVVVKNDYTLPVKTFDGHEQKIQELPSESIVQLSVYIESRCGDTTNFLRHQLLPTWRAVGSSNRLKLRVIPFGKAHCRTGAFDSTDLDCSCQHGPTECDLNQLMNCVIDDSAGDPDVYLDIVDCIQGRTNLSNAVAACVQQLVDVQRRQRLVDCARGKHGRQLHDTAGRETFALNPSLTFVPWIVLNGRRSRDSYYDLLANVCALMSGTKPTACT